MKKKVILTLTLVGLTLGITAQTTWRDWAQARLQGANQQFLDTMKRYQGSLTLGTAATALYMGAPKKETAWLLALYWLFFKALKTDLEQGIEDFVYQAKYGEEEYSSGFQLGNYYITFKSSLDRTKATITIAKKISDGDLSLDAKGSYKNVPLTEDNLNRATQQLLGTFYK